MTYRVDSFDATAGAGGASTVDGIALGPDGNLWFTDSEANQVGRVTSAGAVTRFPLAGEPTSITAGPGGALWITRDNANDVVKLSTAGTIVGNFPISGAYPLGITAGPDGNLWFTEFSTPKVVRMTPTGTLTEVAEPGQPTALVGGPDGNMWVAGGYDDDIVKYPIGLGSAPTAFPVRDDTRPGDITSGPDGRLWFAEWNSPTVGAITTAGMVSEYPLAGRLGTSSIANGGDGALWVSSYDAADHSFIERIDTSGRVTASLQLPNGSSADQLSPGPAGTVWYTDGGADRIGRITPVPDVVTPPPVTPGDARPVLKLGKLAKRARLGGKRGGRLTLSVKCNETCDLTARAKLRTKGSMVAARSVTKQDVAAGQTAKLTLKLSRKAKRVARRALRRKRKASVVVSIKATDSAGQTTGATVKIKLKP